MVRLLLSVGTYSQVDAAGGGGTMSTAVGGAAGAGAGALRSD